MRQYLTWTPECKLWALKALPHLICLTWNNIAIEFLQEINYDIEEMTVHMADNEHILMGDQLGIYKTIILSIESEQYFFFVDWQGGTGKTFVIKLLAKLHQTEHIIIAVAPNGITATLLSGGHTPHSFFKLPCPKKRGKISRWMQVDHVRWGNNEPKVFLWSSWHGPSGSETQYQGHETLDKPFPWFQRGQELMR